MNRGLAMMAAPAVILAVLAVGPAGLLAQSAPRPNLYLSDRTPSPAPPPVDDDVLPYNLEEDDPAPAEVTPAPTPTPTPTPKPRKIPLLTNHPIAKETPKPTPARPPIAQVIRPSRAVKSVDPPLDPYDLASTFKTRWDLSSFVITAEEELRFRLRAARLRTQRLARAITALSSEVEQRQRNLHSAALAVYLLRQDQRSWIPIEGRNLTEAQLLAVKATMRQDIQAMRQSLNDYDVLRNTLNESAEEVSRLEEKDADALTDSRLASADAPTVLRFQQAHASTRAALEERVLPIEALKAALTAENLQTIADRRRSIASFAPPPPGEDQAPRRRETTATAALAPSPSDEVLSQQPAGESLKAPERTALIFEAPVNAPVHTPRDGVVVFAGPFRGFGSMVVVEHEKGTFTVYSYLASIQVLERQPVTAGTVLGRAGFPSDLGKSGVHFQVRKGSTVVSPADWFGNGNLTAQLIGS